MSEGSAGSCCEAATTEVLFLTSSAVGFCISGESNLETLPVSTPGDPGVRLVPLRRKPKVLIAKQDYFYWQMKHKSAIIFTNLYDLGSKWEVDLRISLELLTRSRLITFSARVLSFSCWTVDTLGDFTSLEREDRIHWAS